MVAATGGSGGPRRVTASRSVERRHDPVPTPDALTPAIDPSLSPDYLTLRPGSTADVPTARMTQVVGQLQRTVGNQAVGQLLRRYRDASNTIARAPSADSDVTVATDQQEDADERRSSETTNRAGLADGAAAPPPDAGASVQRQPPAATSASATASPAAVPRPSLTELRTIADTYINAEYASAARDGLTDFENVMQPDFDWGTFMVTLGGNLVWAAACFSTGGAAFAISLAGIAAPTIAQAAAAPSRSDFHQQAVRQIDALVANLLGQIDRVTRDVDAQATQNSWDDNQTRHELITRLLRPNFITTVAGGIPAVNRPAIARQIQADLIVKSNEIPANARGLVDGGEVVYYYRVSNHIDAGGLLTRGELYAADHLKRPSDWTFSLQRVALRLPQGGEAAVRALAQNGPLQVASLRFTKRLSITDGSALGGVAVSVNADNQFVGMSEATRIFEQFWESNPMALGSHYQVPGGPDANGRLLVQTAWAGSGGNPPPVSNPEPFSSYW
ncbi:MAG TPA: hypothetical protein VFZ25_10325 [Chloroflexota bacterium]|nr:hypothetical protein [Chloroflexota bacterium]